MAQSLQFQVLNQIAEFAYQNRIDTKTIDLTLKRLPVEFQKTFITLLAAKNGYYKNREEAPYTLYPEKNILCSKIPAPIKIEDILTTAAFYGNSDVMKFFLTQGQFNPNCFGSVKSATNKKLKNHKLTPMMAACLAGNISEISDLIESGADRDTEDLVLFRPIHYAIIESTPKCLKKILKTINYVFYGQEMCLAIYPVPNLIHRILLEKRVEKKSNLAKIFVLLLDEPGQQHGKLDIKDLKFAICVFNFEAVRLIFEYTEAGPEDIFSEKDLNKLIETCNNIKSILKDIIKRAYLTDTEFLRATQIIKPGLSYIKKEFSQILSLLTDKLNQKK